MDPRPPRRKSLVSDVRDALQEVASRWTLHQATDEELDRVACAFAEAVRLEPGHPPPPVEVEVHGAIFEVGSPEHLATLVGTALVNAQMGRAYGLGNPHRQGTWAWEAAAALEAIRAKE